MRPRYRLGVIGTNRPGDPPRRWSDGSRVPGMEHPPSVELVNAFVAEAYPAAAREGVVCEALGDRSARARWTFDDTELRPGGLISGPRIFGLADSALWFATFTVIGIEAMAVTAEMSIRFLRPARGGDLVAQARIDAVTARRIVGSVDVWVDGSADRPVAVAQGTYARPPGDERRPGTE